MNVVILDELIQLLFAVMAHPGVNDLS